MRSQIRPQLQLQLKRGKAEMIQIHKCNMAEKEDMRNRLTYAKPVDLLIPAMRVEMAIKSNAR